MRGRQARMHWSTGKCLFMAKKAIMQLPKNHQEIFSLFYFAEMSIEEIMQQTSKSKASIKSVCLKAEAE